MVAFAELVAALHEFIRPRARILRTDLRERNGRDRHRCCEPEHVNDALQSITFGAVLTGADGARFDVGATVGNGADEMAGASSALELGDGVATGMGTGMGTVTTATLGAGGRGSCALRRHSANATIEPATRRASSIHFAPSWLVGSAGVASSTGATGASASSSARFARRRPSRAPSPGS